MIPVQQLQPGDQLFIQGVRKQKDIHCLGNMLSSKGIPSIISDCLDITILRPAEKQDPKGDKSHPSPTSHSPEEPQSATSKPSHHTIHALAEFWRYLLSILDDNPDNSHVLCRWATIDPSTRRVHISDAGHILDDPHLAPCLILLDPKTIWTRWHRDHLEAGLHRAPLSLQAIRTELSIQPYWIQASNHTPVSSHRLHLLGRNHIAWAMDVSKMPKSMQDALADYFTPKEPTPHPPPTSHPSHSPETQVTPSSSPTRAQLNRLYEFTLGNFRTLSDHAKQAGIPQPITGKGIDPASPHSPHPSANYVTAIDPAEPGADHSATYTLLSGHLGERFQQLLNLVTHRQWLEGVGEGDGTPWDASEPTKALVTHIHDFLHGKRSLASLRHALELADIKLRQTP